ncbi:MAG: hypothetical protein ACR5LA_07710 [Wolbachia sp.]
MLTQINGTIKFVNEEGNQRIQLAISKDDYEKFKEYVRSIDSSKFYADFLLDDRQFYVTGVFEEKEEEGNTVIMPIASANKDANGRALIALEDIKALFGLNDEKKEINVQMLKHPRGQVEELKLGVQELETKIQELQDQLDTAQQEKQDLGAEVKKLKAIDPTALQQQLEEQLKGKNEELENEKKKAEEEQQRLRGEINTLKTANQKANDKQQELEAAKKEVEKALEAKIKELQDQLGTANTEKTDLKTQLEAANDEQKKVSEAIDGLLIKELNKEIKDLIELTGQELEGKVKSLCDEKLKNIIEDFISNNLLEVQGKESLHKELQGKIVSVIETDQSKDVNEIVKSIKEGLTNSIINASKFSKEVADLKVELEAKEKQIKTLEAEKNKADPEKQNLEAEKNKAKAQITTLNTEVKNLKKDLQAQKDKVQQLEKENKELEAKNKTTEQPKQSSAARYTAGIGMGLAVGLIAFTALERTVRLEMLVMVGIAVASAIAAGGITYLVLPSTQVNGAETQEVNENGKSK